MMDLLWPASRVLLSPTHTCAATMRTLHRADTASTKLNTLPFAQMRTKEYMALTQNHICHELQWNTLVFDIQGTL